MKKFVAKRTVNLFPLCLSVFLCVLALLCLTSCRQHSVESRKSYSVRGVVEKVDTTNSSVTVKHEAIPGYMEAMTMPFDVKNTNELRGLKGGDRIAFQMIVTSNDGWIEHIVKLNQSPEQLPSRSSIQVARAVAPMDVGEHIPDFHLTNELGQAVSRTTLEGKAFAITFIFTRCPFPTFCPRMTSNFAEVEKKMSQKGGPQNWQLLSVSFDPAHDTPSKLLEYGKAQHYDPAHWHFLTGSENAISELCDAFDQRFWQDGGSISHNLRTAVIDAHGRLQKLFTGNDWTPDELMAELVKACNPKP